MTPYVCSRCETKSKTASGVCRECNCDFMAAGGAPYGGSSRLSLSPNRSDIIKILGIAVLLWAFLWLVLAGWSNELVVGLLIAIPCGIRRVLDKRPVIIIDEFGMFDRRLGLGTIQWIDIKSVRPGSFESARYLDLRLFNETKYIQRQTPIRRLWIHITKALAFGRLRVACNLLPISPLDLQEAIVTRCEAARADIHLSKETAHS